MVAPPPDVGPGDVDARDCSGVDCDHDPDRDRDLDLDLDLVALASRLRFSVLRLARMLRQQDEGTFGATATSTLATVTREGDPTLGELAASERVAAPTMTKVVAKLEDAGFVRREVDPADRRVSRVLLTPAGRRYMDETRSRRTAWLVEQMEGLPAGDIDRLVAAVGAVERLSSPEPAATTTAGTPPRPRGER